MKDVSINPQNPESRNMQTLIETPLALSPHAMWLRDHDLVVREYQHVHSLNRDGKRFVCANRAMTRAVCADTEEEAEQRYCELFGLTWWKLAEWNLAMAGAEIKREIVQKIWRGGMDSSFANSEQEMELA